MWAVWWHGHEGNREALSEPADTRERVSRWPWCTPERVKALCALLEAGMDVRASCAKLGIPRTSLYEAKAELPDLAEAIESALMEWESGLVASIQGDDDWKAKAWILERRRPKRYAPPPKRLETTGAQGGPIKQSVEVKVDAVDKLSPEELERAARALLEKPK